MTAEGPPEPTGAVVVAGRTDSTPEVPARDALGDVEQPISVSATATVPNLGDEPNPLGETTTTSIYQAALAR